MTEPSKTSQPGSPMGADQAKAYVPPQVLKAKPKGQVGGAKVEIKAGADPRRAKTVVGLAPSPVAHVRTPGTAPALVTPPEVAPYMMAMTPPGGAPAAAAPSVNDGALPFTSASAPGPEAVVNGHAPTNGVPTPTGPKQPPLKLLSLGELVPLTSPVGGAAAAHASPAADAAAAMSPAAQQPAAQPSVPPAAAAAPIVIPAAGPDLSATPPPVVVDTAADAAGGAGAAASPWGSSSTPVPADEPAADADEEVVVAGGAEGAAGEHPLATTNSPWSSAHSVDVDALPSTAMLSPAPAEKEPAAVPAVEADTGKSSSTGMTIGLALAALALVGIVAYFILANDRSTSGPADVKVGTEQKDYKDTPLPSAKPTATAAPKPKPVIKTAPKPVRPVPVKPRPRQPPVDIYEDF